MKTNHGYPQLTDWEIQSEAESLKVMVREAAALALTSGDIKFPRYSA